MKAKFVGDRNNPKEIVPDEFEAYGLIFNKGKYTEVPDELAEKFAGNSHYETTGEAKAAEAAKPE